MRTTSIVTKNKLEENQLFKISRFKEVIKRTSPHKHEGYYELIYIGEGTGFHWIETEKYQLAAPELYFLSPGQIHCWQFTSIPRGYVILFREEFLDAIKDARLLQTIKKSEPTTRVNLPNDYKPDFIFEEIVREYRTGAAHSVAIIQAYLQALFSKILQLANPSEQADSPTSSLFVQFTNLLEKRCPELHQVSDYAALLHTTPQNLTAVCRKATARSAGEHISERLLLEAKRYILHTDKTMSEVADILHFNDTSYFIKFFKKKEGVTPVKFRERYFQ